MTPETNPDTTAPDTTAPDTQPDTADTLTIVVDHGITDRLDPLLGDRLGELRARIDARAGIHVDDRGIELRRLVRSRRLRWSSIDRIVLDNRLDLGLSFATRLLPVGRIPVLGDKLRTVVAELVEAATRRLMPEVRADAGWVVATFERSGALRDDVEVDATGAITALLHPDVTAAIELQAEQRGIPRDPFVTSLPAPLAAAAVASIDEALERCVTSGTVLTSGLATSEPTALYARLWDHIRAHDLTGVEIRQGLFIAAHPLLVGDELAAARASGTPPADDSALGRALGTLQRVSAHLPFVGDDLADKVGAAADQMTQLRLLTDHLDELRERDVRFVSAFLGPASNTIIPDTAAVRALAPEYAGRNRVSAGVVDYQPVHFPDAAWALSHRVGDGGASTIDVDVHALVTTEPDADGRLSLGMSNGVDGDLLPLLHEAGPDGPHLLLVLSSTQPWVEGLPHAPNTLHVDDLAPLASAGRLTVVRDDSPVPSLPAGSFDASDTEATIGRLVAEHITEHLERTAGRALQVGIGGTGLQAVRLLDEGPWTGRAYTEMLDPVTWSLLESGTLRGTHTVHAGRRDELDGQLLATFALGEEGDGFAQRLDRDQRLRLAPSGHVLQQEAFHGGLGVNNVLGIDLDGHVNAFGRDANPWTGVGGQATIMRGLAVGGIAYLCLKSTHRTPEGELRSSIFPSLPQGTPVALTGPDLFGTRDDARIFVVTEHGVACVNARTRGDFIRALVPVAHPDHRDELVRAAWERHRVRV